MALIPRMLASTPCGSVSIPVLFMCSYSGSGPDPEDRSSHWIIESPSPSPGAHSASSPRCSSGPATPAPAASGSPTSPCVTRSYTAGGVCGSAAAAWLPKDLAISCPLLEWPRTIANKWIPRPDIDELFTALTQHDVCRSAHMLLGPPGPGRARRWPSSPTACTTRTGRFSRSKPTDSTPRSEALIRELELLTESAALVAALASEAQPCAVLIDHQLDVISSLVEREPERLEGSCSS